jgi:hypothetical protein
MMVCFERGCGDFLLEMGNSAVALTTSGVANDGGIYNALGSATSLSRPLLYSRGSVGRNRACGPSLELNPVVKV